MSYKNFVTYNMVGGISWISLFLLVGYFFGNLSFVSKNFTVIIYAIILISVMPAIYEFARQKYFTKVNTDEDILQEK
jgi:membrane-associated protein